MPAINPHVVIQPAVETPEITYPLLWIQEYHVNAPAQRPGEAFGTDWYATAYLVPMSMDGQYYNYAAGFWIRIDNLWPAMMRCHQLAGVMGPTVAGINAWLAIVESDRIAAVEAETARLAQVEADRVAAEQARAAAEQARLDAIEVERLAEIERQRLADEAEADRLAEYNSPTAKAARKQAALDEAAVIEAQAKTAQEDADAAAIEAAEPEVVAAVKAESLRQVAYDAQQKQSIAEQLAAQAAAAKAAAEAME